MKLRYEITVEDLVALHGHALVGTSTGKGIVQAIRWLGGAVIVLISLIALQSGAGFAAAIMACCIVLPLYWWQVPGLLLFLNAWVSPLQYSTSRDKTLFCWREMELLEDGLLERTPYSEYRCRWEALERIDTAPGYTFLFLGTSSAFILPHRNLTQEELEAFLSEVARKIPGTPSASPG